MRRIRRVRWIAQIQWLVAAGVTIGLGEFLECTYYLIVLNWGERSRRLDITRLTSMQATRAGKGALPAADQTQLDLVPP